MDVFSFGCLAFELYSGKPLLPSTDDVGRMFVCMESVIGPFNRTFVAETRHSHPDLFSVIGPVRVQTHGVTEEELEGLKGLKVCNRYLKKPDRHPSDRVNFHSTFAACNKPGLSEPITKMP